MSKNISIQEGSIAKQLTVDKLKTNLVGGGTQLWVPEDDVQLTTKTITENGTYKASDDGYYGYEQVVVNIANVGTATGTDGDGDEAVAYTDPETGELVTDKVPSSIYVVTQPYNPYGIYTNGQAIDTSSESGFDVVALLASGEPYDASGYSQGHIPNGELSINPTTAVYDASTDEGASATSEIEAIQEYMPIAIASAIGYYTSDEKYHERGASPFDVIAAFQDNDGARFQYIRASSVDVEGSSSNYTLDNRTVYYMAGSVLDNSYNLTSVNRKSMPSVSMRGMIAWTMVYGQKTYAGSHQTINVSWPRPLDGKVLETTFEILVAPSPSGDDDQ